MNEKYLAIAVIAVVIVVAIISACFLLATANEDNKCDICGMNNCQMDHSNDTNGSSHKENNSSHNENMSSKDIENMYTGT